ncbi:MAG: hypothetical protein ABIP95_06780 [Pelobium sp.]
MMGKDGMVEGWGMMEGWNDREVGMVESWNDGEVRKDGIRSEQNSALFKSSPRGTIGLTSKSNLLLRTYRRLSLR